VRALTDATDWIRSSTEDSEPRVRVECSDESAGVATHSLFAQCNPCSGQLHDSRLFLHLSCAWWKKCCISTECAAHPLNMVNGALKPNFVGTDDEGLLTDFHDESQVDTRQRNLPFLPQCYGGDKKQSRYGDLQEETRGMSMAVYMAIVTVGAEAPDNMCLCAAC
jgi:hypothetical protein